MARLETSEKFSLFCIPELETPQPKLPYHRVPTKVCISITMRTMMSRLFLVLKHRAAQTCQHFAHIFQIIGISIIYYILYVILFVDFQKWWVIYSKIFGARNHHT